MINSNFNLILSILNEFIRLSLLIFIKIEQLCMKYSWKSNPLFNSSFLILQGLKFEDFVCKELLILVAENFVIMKLLLLQKGQFTAILLTVDESFLLLFPLFLGIFRQNYRQFNFHELYFVLQLLYLFKQIFTSF